MDRIVKDLGAALQASALTESTISNVNVSVNGQDVIVEFEIISDGKRYLDEVADAFLDRAFDILRGDADDEMDRLRLLESALMSA